MTTDHRGDQLLTKIETLRGEIRKMNPARLASRVGGRLVEGSSHPEITLSLWGVQVVIPFPSLVAVAPDGTPLRTDLQALLLYHLETSDGAPVEARWISFHELPDGKFYTQAFQGYTGAELVRGFAGSLDRFTQAALLAGGERQPAPGTPGDAAFRFLALPRVPMLAAFWEGDEDFSPNAQVLFDASVPHHLPVDACAILGSTLVRKILKAATR